MINDEEILYVCRDQPRTEHPLRPHRDNRETLQVEVDVC